METDEGSPVSPRKAPAHKSVVAVAAVRDCDLNWLVTLHILSWYHLTIFCSPTWKKHLAGKQYRTDDEVISAVEDFLADQDESFYTTSIQALQHRWKKCVDPRGDYGEK